jgi:xanthine dehydrogenase accessory factor
MNIGDHLREGQLIAEIQPENGNDNFSIISPFEGMLRGLIRPGIEITQGMKIGDVDRRNDPAMYTLVSDKALAVGGAVLEALLVFLKSSEDKIFGI